MALFLREEGDRKKKKRTRAEWKLDMCIWKRYS